MKKLLLIFVGIGFSLLAFAADPVLYFSDLTDAPKTGWEGSATKGAAVTIWGNNFGSSRGSSYVTVNGVQLTSDSDYAEWGATANNARGMERITFWLNNSCANGYGTISVTVDETASNTLPFYVRITGNIYFVDDDGNDGNNGWTTEQSWATIAYARQQINSGDLVYIKDGIYSDADSYGSILYLEPGINGSENNYTAFIGYPTESPILSGGISGTVRNNYSDTGYTVLSRLKLVATGIGVRIQSSLVGHYRIVGLDIDGQGIYPTTSARAAAITPTNISNLYIYGCKIHGWGYDKYDHGIYAGGDLVLEHIDIAWNEVYSLGTDCSGIYIHPSDGGSGYADEVDIHDNFCYNLEHAGIHIASHVQNVRIWNNTCYDCGASLGRGVIHFNTADGNGVTSNIQFFNNALYSSANAAMVLYQVDSNVSSRNNIFHSLNSTNYYIDIMYQGTHSSDHDCYYGNGSAPAWTTNAINADPQFVNAAAYDFRLNESSPCRDAGTADVLSVVTRDYAGLIRPQGSGVDIGAYEYASTEPDTTAPVIADVASGSITSSSAIISWTTDEPATSQVEYGLTDGYGLIIAEDASYTINHSVIVTGLSQGTTYHFRVISKDSSANQSLSGDDVFTTEVFVPDTTPPVISDVNISPTGNSAVIAWNTDEPATSQVDYGLTAAYGSSEDDMDLVQAHSLALTGLTAGTTYYYEIVSLDGNGNESSQQGQFATLSDTVLSLAFDENSGTAANDSSDCNNDGSIVGASWIAGQSGSALSFNGTGNYVNVPHSDSLNLNSQMTISAWISPVQPNDGNVRYIVFKNDLWGVAKRSEGTLYAYTNIGGTERFLDTGYVPQEGLWTHVAYTFDGNTMRFYADGQLQAQASYSGAIATSPNPVYVGMHNSQWYWNGGIDSVKIFSRALSAAEVLAEYNGSADSVSPAAINDLAAATGSSEGEVDLSWTAPGDDGSSGTANAYIVRYSTSSIDNDAEFDAATDVTGEPAPQAAGTSQSMTVSGLTGGQTYYFAIKARDESGNISGISNCSSAAAGETAVIPNNPPLLDPVGNKSTDEGLLLQFEVSAQDADADTLTYSISGLPGGATFSGAAFTWTPQFTQAGSYNMIVTVDDNNGGTDSEAITVIVNDVNRAPVLNPIGDKSLAEGGHLGFTASASDPDADPVTIMTSQLQTWMSFDGTAFTADPGFSDSGTYAVTFTATDGSDNDSETITITVGNVNQAPVLDAVAPVSGVENVQIQFTVNAVDPDGDSLIYSASGLPGGATFSAQTFTWTPATGQAGSYSVTFSVSDGNGGSDSETASIIIDGVDQTAPYVDGCNPEPDEVQVPWDTNIIFHVKDDGVGVSSNSITVKVQREGDPDPIVVIADNACALPVQYSNSVSISGTPQDYTIRYDPPSDMDYRFSYEQRITITVSAEDLNGNALSEYSYSFTTAMVLRGPNVRLLGWMKNVLFFGEKDRSLFPCAYAQEDQYQDNSQIVMNESGDRVYIVWQEEPSGKIWFVESQDRGKSFINATELSDGVGGISQRPAIALDGNGNIYVAWQTQNESFNWDLYFARRLAGDTDFETGIIPLDQCIGVTDQIHPCIEADDSGIVGIAWANRNGVDGVYCASSADFGASFWNIAVSAIRQADDGTSLNPETPQIKKNYSGEYLYVAWSAEKGSNRNIYVNKLDMSGQRIFAVDSQVNDSGSARNPSLDASPFEDIGAYSVDVCVAWEGTDNGDADIFYDSSREGSVWRTDVQVNDDAQIPRQQKDPVVAIDSYGEVFVIWSDMRNGDWDVYFALSIDKGQNFKTNMIVNDDTGTAEQSSPGLFLSRDGLHLGLTWTDSRLGGEYIFFNRNTVFSDDETYSEDINNVTGGVVSAAQDSSIEGAEVNIPPMAMTIPATVSVTKVESAPPFSGGAIVGSALDFGPSGTRFVVPVTIRIPYTQEDLDTAGISDPSRLAIYYYNLKTLVWERVNGSYADVEDNVICAPVNHFSIFGLGLSTAGAAVATVGGGGGGGGGGCFIATASYGTPLAKDVDILRNFRDEYLLTNWWGSQFVKFYYRHGPGAARFIEKREWARSIVRNCLKPFVLLLKKTGIGHESFTATL